VPRTPALRATIAYDGTEFSGFQTQRSRALPGQAPVEPGRERPRQKPASGPHLVRTVQGVLEDALGQILQQPTPLLAAGRTDSGVHAVGQVVAFTALWARSLDELHRAWNAVLPDDVAVRSLALASPGFHPRFDALGRTYSYTIWNHPVRSPLLRRSTLWVRRQLDIAAMNEAAQLIVGSHDFATFGTAPQRTPGGLGQTVRRASTVRHVIRAAWSRACEQELCAWPSQALAWSFGDASSDVSSSAQTDTARWQGLSSFYIEANAFLYRMVRSIVGTLIQVGRGDLSVSQFASALHAVDRARAGPTAPPQGLCLVAVRYPMV
jgi:tRNA pseudouridine38-40 synthase